MNQKMQKIKKIHEFFIDKKFKYETEFDVEQVSSPQQCNFVSFVVMRIINLFSVFISRL